MTPPPQPSHVRWFGRSDDDPNRLLIIEDEHSKVFLDAELREELYAAILGCASHSSAPSLKGELEYGSILTNGEDWRLRKFDAEMGETEYRIFRNEKFFAQFENRKDADLVMVAMTTLALLNPCAENGCTDTENCDEICEHSRIYTLAQMQQARQDEREKTLLEVIGEMEKYRHNSTNIYLDVIFGPILQIVQELRKQEQP